MGNHHPLQTVRVGEMAAEVDQELAPVIEALWRNGFGTYSCCQELGESLADMVSTQPHMARYVENRRGYANIDFPVGDGLAFLTAIANAGPRDDFYVRMVHWTAPDAWDVAAKPEDVVLEDEELASEFGLDMLQICFPTYDIAEILRRLQNVERGLLTAPAPVDWSTVEVLIEDDSDTND